MTISWPSALFFSGKTHSGFHLAVAIKTGDLFVHVMSIYFVPLFRNYLLTFSLLEHIGLWNETRYLLLLFCQLIGATLFYLSHGGGEFTGLCFHLSCFCLFELFYDFEETLNRTSDQVTSVNFAAAKTFGCRKKMYGQEKKTNFRKKKRLVYMTSLWLQLIWLNQSVRGFALAFLCVDDPAFILTLHTLLDQHSQSH